MRNLISFIGGLAWGVGHLSLHKCLGVYRFAFSQCIIFTPINFISFYQKKIYSHTVILDATLIREK